MSFYSSIANYYDRIFPLSEAQLNFVINKLNPIKSKTILEVGSGTGNLALALAEKEATVSGIDISDDMIDIAKGKIQSTFDIKFQNLNMLDIQSRFMKNSLDAIICFGNTLVHLQNLEEVKSFITKTRLLLNNEGSLLLQIVNYDWVLDNKIDSLPTIENDFIKFERNYVYENNKIVFNTNLYIKETDTVLNNSETLLALRQKELVNLLKDHLFSKIECYGNFKKTEISSNSKGLIILAKI